MKRKKEKKVGKREKRKQEMREEINKKRSGK